MEKIGVNPVIEGNDEAQEREGAEDKAPQERAITGLGEGQAGSVGAGIGVRTGHR
jgi:hypothetical protein